MKTIYLFEEKCSARSQLPWCLFREPVWPHALPSCGFRFVGRVPVTAIHLPFLNKGEKTRKQLQDFEKPTGDRRTPIGLEVGSLSVLFIGLSIQSILRLAGDVLESLASRNLKPQPCGCVSKPMVWARCTTHFSLFWWGFGCSPGARDFDPQPCSFKGTPTPRRGQTKVTSYTCSNHFWESVDFSS